MIGELFVVLEIYTSVASGSGESWQHVGSLYRVLNFGSLKICEGAADADYTQRYLAFMEETARVWWLDELDVERHELRIESTVECTEIPPEPNAESNAPALDGTE